MRIFRWTLIGLLIQLLVGVAAAAAEFPGRTGRIFFTTPSRGDFPPECGIASVSPNGTGYECSYPFEFAPSLSPDHSLFVDENDSDPTQLSTVRPNGTGARTLTHTSAAQNYAPTFSPDSRQIIYSQYGGSADGLYLMQVDGSGQRQLTSDGGLGPVFSPDGTQIAYYRTGIFIANADGSGSHAILLNSHRSDPFAFTNVDQLNSTPNWSPDGRQIVFTRQTRTVSPQGLSSQIDVYAMNADGSAVRQLTSTPGVNEEEPAWSPDGRQIAYFKAPESNPDGVGEIWVMNADGTGARKVADGRLPHWSTLQGGPGRPGLVLKFRKLNRHRRCLGRLDGFFAGVKTRATKWTGFDFTLYVDGRLILQETNSRGRGSGVDTLRRGRHRLKLVMTDPAAGDTRVRTAKFRRC